MGWHLDVGVAAVVGTHTHVPTADARVLPGGTAFISDVGMTGSPATASSGSAPAGPGVLPNPDAVRFATADENVWINAVVVEVRDDGLAESIEQVLIPAPANPPPRRVQGLGRDPLDRRIP